MSVSLDPRELTLYEDESGSMAESRGLWVLLDMLAEIVFKTASRDGMTVDNLLRLSSNPPNVSALFGSVGDMNISLCRSPTELNDLANGNPVAAV